jgi:hypothetical protein
MLTDNKKKIDWHEEYQEKWLSLDGESLVADPKKLEDWIEALCESIRAEALKEAFNLEETKKDWEEHFYESAWEIDTLKLTNPEKEIINALCSFLPRHMNVYDWNLPYAEETILIIRSELAKLSKGDDEEEICICGQDDPTANGMRMDIICPKHDET